MGKLQKKLHFNKEYSRIWKMTRHTTPSSRSSEGSSATIPSSSHTDITVPSSMEATPTGHGSSPQSATHDTSNPNIFKHTSRTPTHSSSLKPEPSLDRRRIRQLKKVKAKLMSRLKGSTSPEQTAESKPVPSSFVSSSQQGEKLKHHPSDGCDPEKSIADQRSTTCGPESVDKPELRRHNGVLSKLIRQAKSVPKALLSCLTCTDTVSVIEDDQPTIKKIVEASETPETPSDRPEPSEEFKKRCVALAVKLRKDADEDFGEHLDAHYLYQCAGNNNDVHIIQFTPDNLKVCLRIPICGMDGKWFPNDKRSLRSQALSMRFISENIPDFPIPQVIAYDISLDNEIGCPYIMMSFVEGRTLQSVWFNVNQRYSFFDLERCRCVALMDLAKAAAKLRELRFDKLGSLDFVTSDLTAPQIGPYYNQNFGTERRADFVASDDTYLFGPCESMMEDRIMPRARHWWSQQQDENRQCKNIPEIEVERLDNIGKGTIALYNKLLMRLPSYTIEGNKGSEPFYLHNVDFDLQNILVDERGNLKAILDWDRCETAPAWLSWACPPVWLCADWEEDYEWPTNGVRNLAPWELEKYRRLYCSYLQDAADFHPDTLISKHAAMMKGLFYCIGTEDHFEILGKFLEILVPRVNEMEFYEKVGAEGLTEEENDMLDKRIDNLFKPDEVPEMEIFPFDDGESDSGIDAASTS
ncbi:MAG: hypothetical protein M1820_006624 [Bogoriella megaspora]|nr:MAG: hypothetical protein M1820_006624 [Bogoriella megaspora]